MDDRFYIKIGVLIICVTNVPISFCMYPVVFLTQWTFRVRVDTSLFRHEMGERSRKCDLCSQKPSDKSRYQKNRQK